MMKPFVSIGFLTVNGKTVEKCGCEITDDKEIICSLCVQANLIIGQRMREKKAGNPDELAKVVERLGVRGTAKEIGVSHVAVQKWMKRGKFPAKYAAKIARLVTP